MAMLLALGTWQVLRLQWKERLIEARAGALTANPVTMADIEAGIEHGYDVDFLKVRMTGDTVMTPPATSTVRVASAPALQVITPFIDRTGFVVLGDRGFIDEARLRLQRKAGVCRKARSR